MVTKKSKGTTFKIGDIFSLSTSKGGTKNFSTSFEYQNVMFDLKGNVKNNEAKLNINIDGKNFGIKGIVTISNKLFRNLHAFFIHIIDNIKRH